MLTASLVGRACFTTACSPDTGTGWTEKWQILHGKLPRSRCLRTGATLMSSWPVKMRKTMTLTFLWYRYTSVRLVCGGATEQVLHWWLLLRPLKMKTMISANLWYPYTSIRLVCIKWANLLSLIQCSVWVIQNRLMLIQLHFYLKLGVWCWHLFTSCFLGCLFYLKLCQKSSWTVYSDMDVGRALMFVGGNLSREVLLLLKWVPAQASRLLKPTGRNNWFNLRIFLS